MTKKWNFLEQEDRLPIMEKISSAISGREVQVRYSHSPMAARIPPKEYFSRVLVPQNFFSRKKEALLRGALFHEVLHVMGSDYRALQGITWGLFLMSNALEDFRLERAAVHNWQGLARPIRILLETVLEFRLRQKGLASTAETARLYEVGVAIYLILSDIPENVVSATVSTVATGIAQELLTSTVRERILAASSTAEIVEIARDILNNLEAAAQKVSTQLGTAAARRYVSALRGELQKAQSVTVEEMLARIFAPKPLPGWIGPFYHGGSISFVPEKWEWPPTGAGLEAPALEQLLRWVLEIDPLREHTRWLLNQRRGRFVPSAQILAQAAAGNERVMQKAEMSRWLVIPYVLNLYDFYLVIEAHSGHAPSTWSLIESSSAAMARLLTGLRSNLAVRAFKATRREVKKEFINAQTKQKFTRTEYEYLLHIATLKGPTESWSAHAEARLADLSAEAREGFNIPLEYRKVVTYDINFPRTEKRRVFIIFGDALAQQPWSPGVLNVGRGHLTYATAPLCQEKNSCVLYVHCGPRFKVDDERCSELFKQFDAVVTATRTQEAVIGIMRMLLFNLFAGRC